MQKYQMGEVIPWRECILRYIQSLQRRKGSQTMEYIVIIAVGALFATILLNAIQ